MGEITISTREPTPEQIAEIHEAVSPDSTVEVKASGIVDRPYSIRVYDGLIHAHMLKSVSVVGVSVKDEYTLVMVSSNDE